MKSLQWRVFKFPRFIHFLLCKVHLCRQHEARRNQAERYTHIDTRQLYITNLLNIQTSDAYRMSAELRTPERIISARALRWLTCSREGRKKAFIHGTAHKLAACLHEDVKIHAKSVGNGTVCVWLCRVLYFMC
jgi:hypothetical protein